MMPASSLRGCRLLLASALFAAVPAFAAPATVAPAKIQVSPAIDAAVKITHYTHELPHEDDIARVRAHLVARGWPFSDEPDPDGDGPTDGDLP